MKLELASEIIARAQREAQKIGVAMSFAVVDLGGHLVALSRMDGASFLTAEIAAGKAYTAVAFGVPWSAWVLDIETTSGVVRQVHSRHFW